MDPEFINSVKLLLKQEKKAMIAFVEMLAMTESPSTVPEAQEEVLTIINQALESLDYKVTRVRGTATGGYLYARPMDRVRTKPIQLLIGHCDTVWPLNTVHTMPVVSDETTVKGPGVYDMKGGLTQLIFALRVIKLLKQDPSVTPVVLVNSDEEIGSKESTNSIRRLAKLADRAYILEPSLGLKGRLKTQRKGVGRFTIRVQGKSAHAGLDPGAGANAIVELSHLIQELFKMNDPEKQISVNVGMVEGGIRPNVVAPESKAVVDVRVPTQRDAEHITDMIHNLKPMNPEVKVNIDGHIGRLPMEPTPQNQALWEQARKAGNLIGIELEEAAAGGGSDGNTTSQFTATLDGLGATGDGAHAPHEFMYIDKMIERTALLVLLMMMGPVQTQIAGS